MMKSYFTGMEHAAMFGYVTADLASLKPEQKQRYRSCYCGLCRKIGMEYGNLQRVSLSYDLTFLSIFLSSLYEPTETTCTAACIAHPFQKNEFVYSDCTSYAAAMSMALSYHKCKDDWNDEKRFTSLALSAVYRNSIHSVSKAYPRQWQAISSCISALSQLERDHIQNPDTCAAVFGQMMEELFIWKHDRWEQQLRRLGNSLGQFIYLMDALLDLPEDIRTHRFNPFSSRSAEQDTDITAQCTAVLNILMGECSNAFEQLPLVQDLDLMRNILYSGVWMKYNAHYKKEAKHV